VFENEDGAGPDVFEKKFESHDKVGKNRRMNLENPRKIP
jgi:hypothetical protein